MKSMGLALLVLVAAGCSGGPTQIEQELPSTASPTAVARPEAAPEFEFRKETPVFRHGAFGDPPHLYVNPGAVVYDQGAFHMLFNSFTAWPGVVSVGYAHSVDGLAWELAGAEPALVTDQIPFGQGQADVSSLVRQDDGSWAMFFHTVTSGIAPMYIGRATAESLAGPWQVDPEPVLSPGMEGAWDDRAVMWPSVVRDQDGSWWMFYGGMSSKEIPAIGLARSDDGVVWVRHDDPSTTSLEFASGDPVLTAGAAWERGKLDRPRVVRTPAAWVMIYQAGPIENRGLATSTNGIVWTADPANPLFTADDFPIENARTWDTALVEVDGAFHYFMELGSLQATDIYLAVHPGPIGP